MRTVYNSPIAFRHCRISQVKQLLNGDIAYQASLVSGRHNIKPVNPQSGRVTLFIFPIGEADRVLGFSRRLYRFRALGALNVNNHIILNTIQNGIAIRDSVAFRRAHASFSHKVANGHVARQSGTNGAYHRINRVTSGNAVVHRAFPEVERNLFGRSRFRSCNRCTIACSKRRNRNANAKHQHCYTARQQTTKLFRFLHVITPFFKYLFQPLQPRPHV